MSYKLSQKELDALEIAGFSSISELLARYFELVKATKNTEKIFKEYIELVDAVGTDKCQIKLYTSSLDVLRGIKND